MREILDELMEVIAEMWERSNNEEIELIDVALPLKAALLLAEGETYFQEEAEPSFFKKIFGKTRKRHYPVSNNTKKKKFKFGRS